MKKKVLSAVLPLCLTAALLLGGCGSDSASESTAPSSESADADGESSTAGAEWTGQDDYADVYDAPIVDEKATVDNIDEFIDVADFMALKGSLSVDETIDRSSLNELIAKVAGYQVEFDEADYGCTVLMDYEGKIDDVAFEGGTAQNATLVLGSHSFIDDFEDELVGVKAGEVRDVYVTFPSSYGKADLAGKDAVFTCTVHKIYRNFWDCLISGSTVKKLPQDIQDIMLETVKSNYESAGAQYNMSAEDYKAAAGITMSDEDSARQEVKWVLTNIAVLKACGVTEDSDLYQDTMDTLLSLSGFDSLDAAVGAGISEDQIHITTQYYTAMTAALKKLGYID